MSQDRKLYIFFGLSLVGAVIVFGVLLFFLSRQAPATTSGSPTTHALITISITPTSLSTAPAISLSNVGYISNRPLMQYMSVQGQTTVSYVVYEFAFDVRNTGKTKESLSPSIFAVQDDTGGIYVPTTDGTTLAVNPIVFLPNTDTIIRFNYTIDSTAGHITFVNKNLGSTEITLHKPSV